MTNEIMILPVRENIWEHAGEEKENGILFRSH